MDRIWNWEQKLEGVYLVTNVTVFRSESGRVHIRLADVGGNVFTCPIGWISDAADLETLTAAWMEEGCAVWRFLDDARRRNMSSGVVRLDPKRAETITPALAGVFLSAVAGAGKAFLFEDGIPF